MSHLRSAVGLAFLLVAPAPAWAACTLEQIERLLQSGFSHDQVTQICAGLQLPGSQAPTGAAPAPSDGSVFVSDVLTPEVGDDGVWKKYVHDGNYVLHNKGNPGAGFILLAQRGDANWRSFGTKVRFTHERVVGGLAGAALAYESGAPGGDIILFSLQVDGTVAATRNSGNDMVPLASRKDPDLAVPDWRFVELAVARHEDTAEFLVGGKSTGLSAPMQASGGGSFGIAVFGVGGFEFRGFVHAGE
jgi:hypothetical protein